MDDAKYVFISEVKERKRVARGASTRVGQTKKCTLPYELMSKEERKKYMQASEVVTFTLRPMSLKEFKAVSADKQVELLKWYGGKYGWNAGGVAWALGTSYQTAQGLLQKFMLESMFKSRMKECTKEQKAEFIANRRAYDASVLTAPQEDDSGKDTLHSPEAEKPTQRTTGPNIGGSGLSTTLNFASKDGKMLGIQLRGIAGSLDPETKYKVILWISHADEEA